MAWAYTKYQTDPLFEKLERQARPLSPIVHRHKGLQVDEGKSGKPPRDQTKGNKQKADDKLLLAILGLPVVHHELRLVDRSDIKRSPQAAASCRCGSRYVICMTSFLQSPCSPEAHRTSAGKPSRPRLGRKGT